MRIAEDGNLGSLTVETVFVSGVLMITSTTACLSGMREYVYKCE